MINFNYCVKVYYAGGRVKVDGYDATTTRVLGTYQGAQEESYITETYIVNSWYLRDYLYNFIQQVDAGEREILVTIEHLKNGIKKAVLFDLFDDDFSDIDELITL